MTVRVERTFLLDATPNRVWAFISDPANRAQAISVVTDWSIENGEATWYLELPIPFVNQTFAVRTEEIERVEGERVRFVGRSSVMNVEGEHELLPTDEGTKLVNRFIVDGRLPGVETFFERNFDRELDNLHRALEQYLQTDA